MQLENEIYETINRIKENTLELDKDQKMNLLKSDFSSVTESALEQSMNYIIKSMPIPDAVKDVLQDVKSSLKTRNLKYIIKTAVGSSLREGLESMGISKSNINSLDDVKNTALKGGLVMLLKGGIEIIEKAYLKNNIVSESVYKFFDKLKDFVLSKNFLEKIGAKVDKLEKKKETFLNKCEDWYNSYKNLDTKEINRISEELMQDKYILSRYDDCIKENNIIQNMTKMINNKKTLLTQNQERLCEAL